MTAFYTTYEVNHTTFGGKIYTSDFDSEYATTISDIADRIISDMKFDERCKRFAENRDRKTKF